MPGPSRDPFRTRLPPAWNDSDSGHLFFPRAPRPSGMRCSPPEYVRVHYPALCERYLLILPWTTSITAAAKYCPKTFVLAAAVAAAGDSARAELGDAAPRGCRGRAT